MRELTYEMDLLSDDELRVKQPDKWAQRIKELKSKLDSSNKLGMVFIDRPLLVGQKGWRGKFPLWSADVPTVGKEGFLLLRKDGKTLKSVKNQSVFFRDLYAIANLNPNRRNITSAERATIFMARVDFFQQWQTNQELITDAGALVEVVLAKMESWSQGRLSRGAMEIQKDLHKNQPPYAQWMGLRNQAALTLALDNTSSIPDHGAITSNMVDSFVSELSFVPGVSLSAGETGIFTSDEAQQLREYLLRVFMSIDSRIDFSDLKIRVRDRIQTEVQRGRYLHETVTIEVKPDLVNTVAHEVGHYLMHKWGRELSGDPNWETASRLAVRDENIFYNSPDTPVVSEPRVEWFNQFRAFIADITERSDRRRTERQAALTGKRAGIVRVEEDRKIEAFARFVDFFTEITQDMAAPGSTLGGTVEERKRDKLKQGFKDDFNTKDFYTFVRLLQTKQALDMTDHNPFGTEHSRLETPYNRSWLRSLPDPILYQAARMGAVLLDQVSGSKLALQKTQKIPKRLTDKEFNKQFLEVLGAPYQKALWEPDRNLTKMDS